MKARREAWEAAELKKLRAKGRPPKDDRWKQKYKEPQSPDTTGLPALPEGWAWATVDQLASGAPYSLGIGPFGSNLKVSDYRVNGVPLIFVRHIRSGNFTGLDPKFVAGAKAAELKAHAVYGGEILVTKMGDPPGDAAIYPVSGPRAIITADCIKWKLPDSLLSRVFWWPVSILK